MGVQNIIIIIIYNFVTQRKVICAFYNRAISLKTCKDDLSNL